MYFAFRDKHFRRESLYCYFHYIADGGGEISLLREGEYINIYPTHHVCHRNEETEAGRVDYILG